MFYRAVQADKLAGHFPAPRSVRPGAGTPLMFQSYQLCQARMDGNLSSERAQGIIEVPSSQTGSAPSHRLLCAPEGEGMKGGSPLALDKIRGFCFYEQEMPRLP